MVCVQGRLSALPLPIPSAVAVLAEHQPETQPPRNAGQP